MKLSNQTVKPILNAQAELAFFKPNHRNFKQTIDDLIEESSCFKPWFETSNALIYPPKC